MNGKKFGLTNRKRQRGITTLGLFILLAFVGIFAFGLLRLTPVYLNYMKVVGVLNGVQEEFNSQGPTTASIVRSLRRRFDVESVSIIAARDVTVTVVDGGYSVGVIYDHSVPFFSNISFVVHFDKSVVVRR